MKRTKILLISSTVPSPSSPSLGVTSIATYLLGKGVDVRIFDDGPYLLDIADTTTDPREMILSVQKTDRSQLYIRPYAERFKDLFNLIDEFKPDLVGVSSTEATFHSAVEYFEKIKKYNPAIKTILGGAFAILAPEIAIAYSSIDMVAIGEGELILEDYCRRAEAGINFTRTVGVWAKNNGIIYKNPPLGLVDINKIAPLRFDLYPIKRFYRPISGAVRRMLPLEVSRGCVSNCSFCASPEFNLRFKQLGPWVRKKSIGLIDRDISTYIRLYNPEYFFIISENFLNMGSKYLHEFVSMYGKYKIPFWMNSRPENIKEERIQALRNVGLERMSIGVECGNEPYRRKFLNRHYSNDLLLKAFDICKQQGVKVTANIMIGLPDETREMILDSARLIKKLAPTSVALTIFQPYKGTRLYSYAVEKNYYDPNNIISTTCYTPYLNMPNLSPEEILKLLYTFNLYVKTDELQWAQLDSIKLNCSNGQVLLHQLLAQHSVPSAA